MTQISLRRLLRCISSEKIRSFSVRKHQTSLIIIGFTWIGVFFAWKSSSMKAKLTLLFNRWNFWSRSKKRKDLRNRLKWGSFLRILNSLQNHVDKFYCLVDNQEERKNRIFNIFVMCRQTIYFSFRKFIFLVKNLVESWNRKWKRKK